MMNTLFEPADLLQLAFESGFSREDCMRALESIRQHAQRFSEAPPLRDFTETRIEQSFNELLFAQLFDYRTLFNCSKTGRYHLQVKHYNKKTGGLDDFSLGFFGVQERPPVVSCELKGPRVELDEPQTGKNYRGRTPVQQAHDNASESAEWVIVSNFKEMRLYGRGDLARYEKFDFDDALSPADVERLLTLFSRRTLLGDEGSKISPLLRVLKRSPLVSKNRPGYVTLVQTMRRSGNPQLEEFAFHKMEDALRKGLAVGWKDLAPMRSEVEGDRLVLRRLNEVNEEEFRLEFTRSGTLRVSEHVPSTKFRPERIAHLVHHFITMAHEIPKVISVYGNIEAQWHLHNIGGSKLSITNEKLWFGVEPIDGDCVVRSGTDASHTPFTQLDGAHPVEDVVAALRELLFPFEAQLRAPGQYVRINPDLEAVKKLLGTSTA